VKDIWIKKADMPTARYCLSVCVLNGKIYAMGGVNDGFRSELEEYDPAKDIWTKKANMPTPRYGLCTNVVNDKIYAIGGTNDPNWNPVQAVEEYDPVKD
jgi:N-acetylneuraminic acid mutarotase